jgi:hypothetical protein
MTSYVLVSVRLGKSQQLSIVKGLKNAEKVSIRFPAEEREDGDVKVLPLTKTQIEYIRKRREEGTGSIIEFSLAQLKHLAHLHEKVLTGSGAGDVLPAHLFLPPQQLINVVRRGDAVLEGSGRPGGGPMVGKGEIQKGVMSNLDIDSVMKKVPGYLGCVSHDKLQGLKVSLKKFQCGIFNLENSGQAGSHWCCWCCDPMKPFVEYFDSYGVVPDDPTIKFLERFKKPIYYNQTQLQKDKSEECGHFCIFYLKHRLNEWWRLRYRSTRPDECAANQCDFTSGGGETANLSIWRDDFTVFQSQSWVILSEYSDGIYSYAKSNELHRSRKSF